MFSFIRFSKSNLLVGYYLQRKGVVTATNLQALLGL